MNQRLVKNIVLRNTTTRKDAAYIIDAVSFHQNNTSSPVFFEVTAYWGRWEIYQKEDLSGLRKQMKYHGSSFDEAMTVVDNLIKTKHNRGYQVIQKNFGDALLDHISMPAKRVEQVSVEVIPEPRQPASRWSVLEL